MNDFPEKAVVSLRYSLGEWNFVKEIPVDFHGTMAIGNGSVINDPGQNADGDSFIQITSESHPSTMDHEFGFAAIAKDGRRMESFGKSTSSAGKASFQRFNFPVPLSEIERFVCEKRPVREVRFPIVLRDSTASSKSEEAE